jgi:hypothetical protein
VVVLDGEGALVDRAARASRRACTRACGGSTAAAVLVELWGQRRPAARAAWPRATASWPTWARPPRCRCARPAELPQAVRAWASRTWARGASAPMPTVPPAPRAAPAARPTEAARWLSRNPEKAWAERWLLGYSAAWMLAVAVVIVHRLDPHVGRPRLPAVLAGARRGGDRGAVAGGPAAPTGTGRRGSAGGSSSTRGWPCWWRSAPTSARTTSSTSWACATASRSRGRCRPR